MSNKSLGILTRTCALRIQPDKNTNEIECVEFNALWVQCRSGVYLASSLFSDSSRASAVPARSLRSKRLRRAAIERFLAAIPPPVWYVCVNMCVFCVLLARVGTYQISLYRRPVHTIINLRIWHTKNIST